VEWGGIGAASTPIPLLWTEWNWGWGNESLVEIPEGCLGDVGPRFASRPQSGVRAAIHVAKQRVPDTPPIAAGT
jgi:hypothetical protein